MGLPATHRWHCQVSLPPPLDPGNSDLFKLGTVQLKQMLGAPSRLPILHLPRQLCFCKTQPRLKPVGANCAQTAGEELRQCWGRMGCWAAALCAPPVRAREISAEEREQHIPSGLQYRCGWEKSRKLILEQRNK